MNIQKSLLILLMAKLGLFVGSEALAARTTTYYHTDGLGSVVAATNDSGQVLWRKDYAPFGEQIDTTPETERTAYTGKQHDDVTGLTYFGARYFNPEIGRFMSVDPVGFLEWNPLSFNRYAYANNNPYRFIDPDGRQSQDASCDEVCEYEQHRQRATHGARIVSQGASDAADVVDREASNAWTWIPFVGGAKKVAPFARPVARIRGPVFDGLKDHAARHSKLHPNAYYNAAVRHLETGTKFTFRHDGQFKNAFITRNGPDNFAFTSASRSGDRILTHMDVDKQYLRNIGIALPKGF